MESPHQTSPNILKDNCYDQPRNQTVSKAEAKEVEIDTGAETNRSEVKGRRGGPCADAVVETPTEGSNRRGRAVRPGARHSGVRAAAPS